MNLLVIDDSKEHLEVIEDIFSNEGYSVTSVNNAFEALRLLEEHKFDCVISDIDMPVLDGKHLLNVIKDKYETTPVVVLSAFIEDEQDLLDRGAYAVHIKPPNVTALVSSVANAINESSNSINFVFNHTNLNQIKMTVVTRLVSLALKKTGGNQMKAAQMLGISRQSLIRYMKHLRPRKQVVN